MAAPKMPSSSDTSKDSTDDDPKKVKLLRRQELERRLKSNPTDSDGFLELAAIYRSEERPLEAKRLLEQAKKIFPDNETIVWEYEEALLARSLQLYREVHDLNTRLDTSETARELKRSEQDWCGRRIEVCKARLARHPKMKHLNIVIAEALLDTDEAERAIVFVDQILDVDELSPQGYLIKGKALLALGKDADAMAALRACGIRRAVSAPPKIKVHALRLLCETAERLGVKLTLERYQHLLQNVEKQLAES